jgi:hypothetical protein
MLAEIMLRVRTYVQVKFMCKITGIFKTSVDTDKLILSVYHPGVFTKLNKMGFISQTHLFIIVLNVLFGSDDDSIESKHVAQIVH